MNLMDLSKEQRQKILDRRGITEAEYLAGLAEFNDEPEIEIPEEVAKSDKFNEPIKATLDKADD
jgi:hypothetical protein